MSDVKEICKNAKAASYELAGYSTEQKNSMLRAIAAALKEEKNIAEIMRANALDVKNAGIIGKNSVFIDRLTLNSSRMRAMTDGLEQVAALEDPVGEVTESRILDNGLELKRVRAPLGVVGIIYEARPNVTVDAAALCLKSGNSVVLRGGKESLNGNRALYSVMRGAIEAAGLNPNTVGFVDDVTRESSRILLEQSEYVDVLIPRGGESLKNFVLENAKMPVIASAGGNCHIYVEKTADLDMAKNIIVNAKTQRPSVCNAAEHLIVDREIAEKFLPEIFAVLKDRNVEIVVDNIAAEILKGVPIATDEDFKTEFLAYKISIAVVDGIEQAVSIINKNGTKHSETIITQDQKKKEYFAKYTDAAAIYFNASTRFTDGFQFGLGAEMGISTQKLHVRGPIALKELTSVKYVVSGNGQVRES